MPTSLDQRLLIFPFFTFLQTSYPNEKVNGTEPSPFSWCFVLSLTLGSTVFLNGLKPQIIDYFIDTQGPVSVTKIISFIR